MALKQYTRENPPKRGNARKIWKALTAFGSEPFELHYNPNNWGRDREAGYGSWACLLSERTMDFGYLCGVLPGGVVYLESLGAPFTKVIVNADKLAA